MEGRRRRLKFQIWSKTHTRTHNCTPFSISHRIQWKTVFQKFFRLTLYEWHLIDSVGAAFACVRFSVSFTWLTFARGALGSGKGVWMSLLISLWQFSTFPKQIMFSSSLNQQQVQPKLVRVCVCSFVCLFAFKRIACVRVCLAFMSRCVCAIKQFVKYAIPLRFFDSFFPFRVNFQINE